MGNLTGNKGFVGNMGHEGGKIRESCTKWIRSKREEGNDRNRDIENTKELNSEVGEEEAKSSDGVGGGL